jgi:hypothetical protein
MIIYNVTLKVHPEITDEWLRWMQDEHMPELKATGLFTDYRLCRLLDQNDEEGKTFCAQYFCDSMEDYHEYVNHHAAAMRDKGLKKFADKFIAFRTVMQVIA